MKFGWTKWGGANREIIVDKDTHWSCQCCGERLSKLIPFFLVSFDDMPTLKLCAKCRHIKHTNNYNTFQELKREVRD